MCTFCPSKHTITEIWFWGTNWKCATPFSIRHRNLFTHVASRAKRLHFWFWSTGCVLDMRDSRPIVTEICFWSWGTLHAMTPEQEYSISGFEALVDIVLGMRDSNPSRHRCPLLVLRHVVGLQNGPQKVHFWFARPGLYCIGHAWIQWIPVLVFINPHMKFLSLRQRASCVYVSTARRASRRLFFFCVCPLFAEDVFNKIVLRQVHCCSCRFLFPHVYKADISVLHQCRWG